MKAISVVLIIFMLLSLTGCYLFDSSYTEIWSCIDEFDLPDFDSDEFLSALQADQSISVEESQWFKENERSFTVVYGEGKVIVLFICEDVDDAKELFRDKMDIFSMIFSPYASLVRVNNIVFYPLPVQSSNDIMAQFMNKLGIENSYNLKVYTKSCLIPTSTDKSLDEIVKEIENRGYIKYDMGCNENEQIYEYAFVSEDGVNMYEIVAFAHEGSVISVLGCLYGIYLMANEDTVTRMYCSFNDGYSMIFFGNSIETQNFWNEIR